MEIEYSLDRSQVWVVVKIESEVETTSEVSRAADRIGEEKRRTVEAHIVLVAVELRN